MANAPTVRVESGLVEGYQSGDIAIFKGVPYGDRVDGDRRWKKAAKPAPWSGTLAAKHHGPRAMQRDADSNTIVTPEVFELLMKAGEPAGDWLANSENCLTVDVWTPSLDANAKLPVMVWIHGGGFFVEVPPIWWTDGEAMARFGEVVVVTLRHRIGSFGYLDLAGLGARDLADAGNVGNLDLISALEWVRDNIAGFGGDPGSVTIFGESGGGSKVSCLLAMPAAKGLFHKAIVQSGARLQVFERPLTTNMATALVEAAVGSTDRLADFRALGAEAILDAQTKTGARAIGPMLDGLNMPAHPFEPVAPRVSADIPVMIGTTRHEMSLMQGARPDAYDLDEAGLAAAANEMLGPDAGRLTRVYSHAHPDASPSELFFLMTSDRNQRMTSIRLAERKAALGRAPVYMYRLDFETDVLDGKLYAPHALDLPLVFNNTDIPFAGSNPARVDVARQMCGAWTSFARTGRPDHPSIPTWAPYTAEDRATLLFNAEPSLAHDPGRDERLAQTQA